MKQFVEYAHDEMDLAIADIDTSKWTIINQREDSINRIEFNNRAELIESLIAYHTEGSHTDHDTYDIYYDGNSYNYHINITLVRR